MKKTTFLKRREAPGEQQKFAPLTDGVEIRSVIEDAVLSGSKVILWLKDREHVINSTLTEEFNLKEYFTVRTPSVRDAKRFLAMMDVMKTTECQLFVYSKNKAIVGFKTKFLRVGKTGLVLEMPSSAFRVQRRKYQRYNIREGYSIDLEFGNPKDLNERIHRNVLDIGAGGLSFVIASDEVDFYKIGMIMRRLKITLRKRSITTDCEIRNISKLPPNAKYQGFKVGVKFRRISAVDVDFINSYIIENTIQFG